MGFFCCPTNIQHSRLEAAEKEATGIFAEGIFKWPCPRASLPYITVEDGEREIPAISTSLETQKLPSSRKRSTSRMVYHCMAWQKPNSPEAHVNPLDMWSTSTTLMSKSMLRKVAWMTCLQREVLLCFLLRAPNAAPSLNSSGDEREKKLKLERMRADQQSPKLGG